MHQITSYTKQIIEYYNTCWIGRFKNGHNPTSWAMHMGFFEHDIKDNDTAKNNMNQFLANQLGLRTTDSLTVVDAGCGIGGTSFYLAKHYPDLAITAINISDEQIELGKSFIAGQTVTNSIRFLNEDYCQTSLASGSTDIVFGIESICHASSKNAFYDEAFRILKPNGILVIIDYVYLPDRATDGTTDLLKTFQNGWAVNEYISAPTEQLGKAGFHKIAVNSILNNVQPGIQKSYQVALDKIALANGSMEMPVRSHLEACIALKKLSDMGVIDYCAIKCYKPQ